MSRSGMRIFFQKKLDSPKGQLLVASTYLSRLFHYSDNSVDIESYTNTWDISFVTNFGRGQVSYTPQELYAKRQKIIMIGPARLTINVSKFSCTQESACSGRPTEASGRKFSVYDTVEFKISYEPIDAAAHEVIFLEFNPSYSIGP